MADVFISYKKEDRARAQALSSALQAHQLSVWWDDELGGGDRFRNKIDQELSTAGAVVVIWSPLAVQSNFVLDEASEAANQKKLVPVTFTPGMRQPMGFREIQMQNLSDWTEAPNDPRVLKLVQRIEEVRSGRMGAAFSNVASAVHRGAQAPDAVRLGRDVFSSLAFVNFLGLPIYRLLLGAIVMTLVMTAIWIVPALANGLPGAGFVTAFGLLGTLSARALHQLSMILRGKSSRHFFDPPFSFGACFSAIAAPTLSALLLPANQLGLLSLLETFPYAFTAFLVIVTAGGALSAAIGRLVAKLGAST